MRPTTIRWLNLPAPVDRLVARAPAPRKPMRVAPIVVSLAVLHLSTATAPLTAQAFEIAPTPVSMRARLTLANAALGAFVGGARAAIAHRPVRRGMALGAIGGATTAVARQVVATRTVVSGLTGRALHGVGLGIGSAAVDSMLTIPLQLGPAVLRFTPAVRRAPEVKLNLTNLVIAAYTRVHLDARIDWGTTLWSGAVAFRSQLDPDDPLDRSRAGPGTIRLAPYSYECANFSDGRPACRTDLAHENIHTLQVDMVHEWLGRPIEAALLQRSRIGRRLTRHMEIGGVGLGIVLLADQSWAYQKRWTEYEAYWLTYGEKPWPQ